MLSLQLMGRKTNRPTSSKVKYYTKYGLSIGRVFLQDLASAIGWIMMSGNYGMGWAEYEEKKERQRAYEEREWLRLLERQKLIEKKRIGEKLMIRLTSKGWQQVLRDKIRCTRKRCKEGICIVVFDVPESEKRVRDMLRYVLAECGFIMLQKSVWVTDKDVVPHLCALLQGANLDRWVRILVGNESRMSAVRRAAMRLTAKHSGNAKHTKLKETRMR